MDPQRLMLLRHAGHEVLHGWEDYVESVTAGFRETLRF